MLHSMYSAVRQAPVPQKTAYCSSRFSLRSSGAGSRHAGSRNVRQPLSRAGSPRGTETRPISGQCQHRDPVQLPVAARYRGPVPFPAPLPAPGLIRHHLQAPLDGGVTGAVADHYPYPRTAPLLVPMPATNTEPLWPGCPHVRPPHPPTVVHPAEVAKEQSDQPLAAAALAQRFTPTVNRPSVPVNRPSVPVPPSNHQPPWCARPPCMYTCCTWSFIWPR